MKSKAQVLTTDHLVTTTITFLTAMTYKKSSRIEKVRQQRKGDEERIGGGKGGADLEQMQEPSPGSCFSVIFIVLDDQSIPLVQDPVASPK